MPDYSNHRLQNWEWYTEYRSRSGREPLLQYINTVYKLLMNMKPGSYFNIEKNVRPENIDLFIKICCMFIQEQTVSSRKREHYHCFNKTYTEIRCIPDWFSKK